MTFPEQDEHALDSTTRDLCDKVIPIKPMCRFGYVDQQITKMQAHHYCSEEVIVFFDSDYVCYQPIKTDDFTVNGKVHVLMTPYSKFESEKTNNPEYDANVLKWRTATSKAIGIVPEFEFMRQVPAVFLAKTLRGIEQHYPNLLVDHCSKLTDTFDFSEFNVMGTFAYAHHPELYTFLNTETDPYPPRIVKQNWSWGGISRKTQKFLDRACQ